MIRLVIKKGVQTITEVCDTCNCHMQNLTMDDLLVKGDTDLIIKDSKGKEVTNKEPRPKCYCEGCCD